MREVEHPSLDALVDAARVGDAPSAEDRERNKRAVLARIAGVAAGGSVLAATSTTAAAAAPALATTASVATTGALLGKLAGGALVLALASVSATVAYSRRHATERAVATSGSQRHTHSSSQPIARPTPRAPQTQAPLVAPSVTTHLTPAPAATVAIAPRASAPSRAPSLAARPSRSSLAEEIALLRAAREALSRNDGALALGALDRHSQRFSQGMLRPESLALRVDALCATGQRERAHAAAAQLAREAPGSPLVARALRACR
jgi:hypothetical protein